MNQVKVDCIDCGETWNCDKSMNSLALGHMVEFNNSCMKIICGDCMRKTQDMPDEEV